MRYPNLLQTPPKPKRVSKKSPSGGYEQLSHLIQVIEVFAIATRSGLTIRQSLQQLQELLALDLQAGSRVLAAPQQSGLLATARDTPPNQRKQLPKNRPVTVYVSTGELIDSLEVQLGEHAGGFISALRASEQWGVPVTDSVERLSFEARLKLRHQCEAQARKLPIAMLFPLVFCVLPAFALLTVVPSLITTLRSLTVTI